MPLKDSTGTSKKNIPKITNIKDFHFLTFPKILLNQDEDHHSDDKEQEQKTKKPSSVKQTSQSAKKSPKKGTKSAKHSSHSSTHVRIGGEDVYEQLESSGSLRDSHLALRAAFYGVLFHAYADMVCQYIALLRNISFQLGCSGPTCDL